MQGTGALFAEVGRLYFFSAEPISKYFHVVDMRKPSHTGPGVEEANHDIRDNAEWTDDRVHSMLTPPPTARDGASTGARRYAAGLFAATGGELLGGPAAGFRALASFKRRAACTMCTT